ncbi:helix-turn-helix transcriptional regulator [Sphingomonas sp.]|uniref:helix-turn-helix domain-containing protein n=1 Tax=Sphingomonas sp. TaxID=28214 RepID=UPI0035C8110E
MAADLTELTPIQIECLRLVARGMSASKAIGRELDLSPGTVDTYLSRASRLLGAASRQEAARMFLEAETRAAECSGSTSQSRSSGVGGIVRTRLARSVAGVRWLFSVPPISGPEHDLNWIEKTLAIVRVAAVSLSFVVALAVTGAGLLWVTS